MVTADLLGWIAMPVSWVAIWALTRYKRWGWAVGLIGDMLWLSACWLSGIPSFMVNECVFILLRAYGWKRWRSSASACTDS